MKKGGGVNERKTVSPGCPKSGHFSRVADEEFSADTEVKDLEAACLVFNLRSSATSADEEGGRPQMSAKHYHQDARNLIGPHSHFPVFPSFFSLLFVPPTGGLSLCWHRGSCLFLPIGESVFPSQNSTCTKPANSRPAWRYRICSYLENSAGHPAFPPRF